MGKDSLTATEKEEKKKTAKKSTTAKKTATKAKSAPKTKKTETKKKKAASTTKRSTKNTKTPTSTPKQKASASKKKKMSKKDLLLKTFDTGTPEKPYKPEPDISRGKEFDAPPYLTGENETEIEQKRKLLFKTFDLREASPEESNAEPIETAPSDSQIPPPEPSPGMIKGSDPMASLMKYFAVGFILLVAIILRVSISNQTHYYLKSTKSGIEIWQGIFAPMGEERIILLPDAPKPESIQAVYSESEIYAIVFNYYVKKADELLEKPGMPDFEGIKRNLDKAMPYAVTEKLRTLARARRNSIDLMILLYKAEVAASKETIPDYDAALEYLREAQTLDVDGSKTGLIKQKVESINTSLSKLKAAEETPQQEVKKDTPPQ